MSRDLSRAVVLVAALAFAGCGPDGATTSPDGGSPPDPDAGTEPASDAHPVSVTADLDGLWQFEAGNFDDEDRFTCDVSVTEGVFDVLCDSPQGVAIISPDCTRVRSDNRATGTLDADLLDGSFDVVDEYEGAGCAELGFPTGIPVVRTEVALMIGTNQPGVGEGFLAFLDGTWQWAYSDEAGSNNLACEVSFSSGAMTVRCPGYPLPVGDNCTRKVDHVIEALAQPTQLAGGLWTETFHDGHGCTALGLESFVAGVPMPLAATKL